MIKFCPKHGETDYVFRPSENRWRCKKCAIEQVILHRKRKKEKLITMFGGKCKICGYNHYLGALQFHHLDPSKKLFSLSVRGLSYSLETCINEAKKCVILCANCHAEVEAGLLSISG